MYRVVLFFKDDYDFITKYFSILSDAEEYFNLMTKEMEHEECPISTIYLYDNNKIIKES